MKKTILIVAAVLLVGMLAGCGGTGTLESSTPETETSAPQGTDPPPASSEAQSIAEPKPEVVQLGVGTMQVYDFGTAKLHAYTTNDALGDVCFLIETDTALVGIEAPAFTDNLTEYVDYIAGLGKPMSDILISAHPTGGNSDLYANASVYATKTAKDAIEGGSTKATTESFIGVFGDAFDANIVEVTDIINTGTVTIGGIEFVISDNGDYYNIEIPAINCVYTHMMGSNVHNILTGTEHIDAMIAQMKSYQDKGAYLVLTAHYPPETLDKVADKIAYLETAKELIGTSVNADEWVAAMKAAFPNYQGENYLEMSAGIIPFS